MGILNDFERRLEGLVEGVFGKVFRTGVHPVELARRILREMDTNRTVGVHEVWVPNRFVFRLAPSDRDRFQGTEKALKRELEQVVRDNAAERGWGLVGPAEVVFETDPSLNQGTYGTEAALVEGPTGGTPAQAKSQTPGPSDTPRAADAATLTVIDRGKKGSTFDLTKDRVVIGRLPESDVTVPDPGVSRRHAEIRRQNGDYLLVDLGSTNGTMVNQSRVGEQVLEEGDRITIGRTVLEFRRR